MRPPTSLYTRTSLMISPAGNDARGENARRDDRCATFLLRIAASFHQSQTVDFVRRVTNRGPTPISPTRARSVVAAREMKSETVRCPRRHPLGACGSLGSPAYLRARRVHPLVRLLASRTHPRDPPTRAFVRPTGRWTSDPASRAPSNHFPRGDDVVSNPVEKHQLVTHDGELSSESLSAYLDTLGARDWNRAYQVVAIMGPQSSGKSTLVNHVFGTSFQEMNHELGRSQTTRGVWIARANRPETFPTIVMDLEGTDGRERGEDDTAFEKQTALFAMATADVLLVNMWCQDIGREVASGKPLLKTIFQVNLKVFNPRKTTLVFVIRDKSRTPLERLRENLREDLDRIWAGITKPDRRDAAFDDFFRLEFVALAHYEHAHEQFLAETAALTRRFESPPNASEDSLRPRARARPCHSAGLAVSFAEAWRAVRENRDLDLPAHRVMVATVRCEEIATSRIAAMRASPELADASRAVDNPTPPPPPPRVRDWPRRSRLSPTPRSSRTTTRRVSSTPPFARRNANNSGRRRSPPSDPSSPRDWRRRAPAPSRAHVQNRGRRLQRRLFVRGRRRVGFGGIARTMGENFGGRRSPRRGRGDDGRRRRRKR